MFQSNKYTSCYLSIVERAKTENRKKHTGIYYENHHIIPRSCGGDNSKNNLVLLTAKEHYVCHLLLPKAMIDPNHRISMVYAFYMMNRPDINKRKYTSRSYNRMRVAYAQRLKGKPGNPHTPQSKEKLRQHRLGKPGMKKEQHPFFGKQSPFAGKFHTAEARAKISTHKLGKPGHKQTETHKAKLKELFSKTWKIIYPCGKEEIINNLNGFCKENGLQSQHMGKVASGERPHHKGYRCEKWCLLKGSNL